MMKRRIPHIQQLTRNSLEWANGRKGRESMWFLQYSMYSFCNLFRKKMTVVDSARGTAMVIKSDHKIVIEAPVQITLEQSLFLGKN